MTQTLTRAAPSGTCGFLKSAGDATVRTSKPGSIVIVITNANETAAVVAADTAAAPGVVDTGTSESTTDQATAQPAPSPVAASDVMAAGSLGSAAVPDGDEG